MRTCILLIAVVEEGIAVVLNALGAVVSKCLIIYRTLHITMICLTLMRNITTRIISMSM